MVSMKLRIVCLALGFVAALAQEDLPTRETFKIPLPAGFQPEGITHGRGNVVYVGTFNGKLFKVNVKTRTVTEALDVGMPFTGIWFIPGRKWVAAAGIDRMLVMDLETKTVIANCPIANVGFVNDVVQLNGRLYFTDSNRPYMYVLPLWRLDNCGYKEVFVTGFENVPDEFNMNGIAKYRGKLLICNTATGLVYQVVPKNDFKATVIASGLPFGDGILVDADQLTLVQNFANTIAVLSLGRPPAPGAPFPATPLTAFTSPDFQVPTTAAGANGYHCTTNSRFDEFNPLEAGSPSSAEAIFDVVCWEAIDG